MNQSEVVDSEFSRLIKFYVLISADIVSVLLNLLILNHFYVINRQQRNCFDDVLILLLVVSLINVVFHDVGVLIYLFVSSCWPYSSIYCFIWNYFAYFDYFLNLSLTCWASIERHLFLFHFRFFANRRERFLFHQIPLVSIIVYGLVVYFYFIVFNRCQNQFDYQRIWCGGVCFKQNSIESYFEWLVNNCLIILLIIVFNLLLIIRFVRQKKRFQENRLILLKSRKLLFQMISISLIYLICSFPPGLISILRIVLGNSEFGVEAMIHFVQYSFIFANVVLPFVILNSLPNLKRKLISKMKRTCRRQTIRVKPIRTENHEEKF